MNVEWQQLVVSWEVGQTWSFRGSKSRNKVSVGEPAEGSLKMIFEFFWSSQLLLWYYWKIKFGFKDDIFCFKKNKEKVSIQYFDPLLIILTEFNQVLIQFG